MRRIGVRLTDEEAIQQRIDMLEQQQQRRAAAITEAKQAMDDHYERRQVEIENLKARLSGLRASPAPLRVAQ